MPWSHLSTKLGVTPFHPHPRPLCRSRLQRQRCVIWAHSAALIVVGGVSTRWVRSPVTPRPRKGTLTPFDGRRQEACRTWALSAARTATAWPSTILVRSSDYLRAPTGRTRAFRWTASGGMKDLGNLGRCCTTAYAINDRGQVVGLSNLSNGGYRAYRWTASGGMQDLGTLGGYGSIATGINLLGQISGSFARLDGILSCVSVDGVRWHAGSRDLDGRGSRGLAINALGHVRGTSLVADGTIHVFRWTASGGMRDLGPFAPTADVSALGHVAENYRARRCESARGAVDDVWGIARVWHARRFEQLHVRNQ